MVKIRPYQEKDKQDVRFTCLNSEGPSQDGERIDNFVLNTYCDYYLEKESYLPKRLLSILLHNFSMLNANAKRKNCVSVLTFPLVWNLLYPKSCFNTPNTPSTCMERFIRNWQPKSEVINSAALRFCSSNLWETRITRLYWEVWH